MRALVAITARELHERWTLPFATLCWGLVLLFSPLRLEVRALPSAALLAVPAAWGLAVILGGSVIARDLADGRLAFFFARPVPWWAIAGGKLLAALLLTLATAVACVVPALLLDWNPAGYLASLTGTLRSGTGAAMLVLLVGLIGFGHAASVVYRARSTWAAIDLLLLGAAVVVGVTFYRQSTRLGLVTRADLPDGWRLALGLLLVALVPLAAALVQVALGRGDLRRGHQALSLTFWGGVLVWFAVIGGLLLRERSATPAGFARRQVVAAGGDGRFVSLVAADGTPQRGRAASFLLDTASGRFLRLPSFAASFTPDGRQAAWMEEAPFWRFHRQELQLVRLDRPGPQEETIEFEPPLPDERVVGVVLDAAAARVAVLQPHTLSVHELPSGRTLSRTAAADGDWVTAAFLDDGRLRALRRVRTVVGGPGRNVIPGFLEAVELAGGVPSSRLAFEAVGHAALASGIGGERILLIEPQLPRTASLHDARTGRRLRVFAGEQGFVVRDAMLLASGGVVVLESDATSTRLRLAADAAADRLVELPAGGVVLGGELPGGRVAVGLVPPGRPGPRPEARSGDTLVVALATGEIVQREAGLLPAAHQGLFGGGGQSPGASTLFQSPTGEIVRLAVETGARQVVLPAKAAR